MATYYFNLKILFVGGTLGLFTGMSLLSIIEIGFWLAKIPIFLCKKLIRPTKSALDTNVA